MWMIRRVGCRSKERLKVGKLVLKVSVGDGGGEVVEREVELWTRELHLLKAVLKSLADLWSELCGCEPSREATRGDASGAGCSV